MKRRLWILSIPATSSSARVHTGGNSATGQLRRSERQGKGTNRQSGQRSSGEERAHQDSATVIGDYTMTKTVVAIQYTREGVRAKKAGDGLVQTRHVYSISGAKRLVFDAEWLCIRRLLRPQTDLTDDEVAAAQQALMGPQVHIVYCCRSRAVDGKVPDGCEDTYLSPFLNLLPVSNNIVSFSPHPPNIGNHSSPSYNRLQTTTHEARAERLRRTVRPLPACSSGYPGADSPHPAQP